MWQNQSLSKEGPFWVTTYWHKPLNQRTDYWELKEKVLKEHGKIGGKIHCRQWNNLKMDYMLVNIISMLNSFVMMMLMLLCKIIPLPCSKEEVFNLFWKWPDS